MNYALEKYVDSSSRHECPACHDRKSFAYYRGEDGSILSLLVGRCNHEVKCGYHYTPGEWFRDHPDEKRREETYPMPRPKERPVRKICTIDADYVKRSLSYSSNFVTFLTTILSPDEIESLMRIFWLGATKNGSVIYWQIDKEGRCRSGKVMQYDPETGHRSEKVSWIHPILRKRGELPEDWTLTQCLFGLHQLRKEHNRGKVVALVESEKTAVIGTACNPDCVWMACGGISQLSAERCADLKGKEVLLYPDTDEDGMTFRLWCQKAEELKKLGCKVKVDDYLERKASAEDREAKIDVGDIMIRELQEKRRKADGVLGNLVRTFNLEQV